MTDHLDAANIYADLSCERMKGRSWHKDLVDAFNAGHAAGHADAYAEPRGDLLHSHTDAGAAFASTRWIPDANMWHETARAFDAGVASVQYRQPERVLTTAAELDALPVYSVVLNGDGRAWQKRDGASWWIAGGGDHDARYVAESACTTMTLVYDPTWQPAPVIPEPIRLTDPDDPRWEDGAKVRGEWPGGDAIEGTVKGSQLIFNKNEFGHAFVERREFTAVYLLAEAPDPDAELVTVLRGVLENSWNPTNVLVDLRTAGYNIVRADS